jgi:3-hydroxyisobutyrate dehydrogenase-like beta-hydroxyacid dehydrogenase
METKRVGFAGLGLMGSRMARNFLKKGFPLTVWNRTPDKAEALAREGAKVARTPRELAEASDVVITCVADPNAVGRIVFAEDGIRPAVRPGFRYVETSTISPGQMRRIAEVVRAKGGDVLEAPVTGSKTGAEKGTLVIMTGGREETLQELMPVLMAIGAKVVHCGDIGHGSVVKLIGNSLISYMLEGLCEGLVVAKKAGVSTEKLLEVVMASGYASPYFPFKANAIAKNDYEQHFSVDLLVKDQGLMLDEAHALQVPMPALAVIREVFQSARAQGLGQEDIAAVYKAVARSAGM